MDIKKQKEELEKLENESLLYKLKRFERKFLKYLRKIFRKSNYEIIERHIEYMEKQEDEYNEAVKKENMNYELKSKEINISQKPLSFIIIFSNIFFKHLLKFKKNKFYLKYNKNTIL